MKGSAFARPDEGILVVEDDDVVAAIVVAKLEREGYAVRRAAEGALALEEAARGDISLFILDVGMPGMDGFDLLRRIRELPACKGVPVLMLTGKNRDTDVKNGIKLGADDYMIKPFMPYELARRVRILLDRRAAEGRA